MKKKYLDNVTLVAVSSIFIPETISALQYSCKNIEFESIKLITHKEVNNIPNNIEINYCDEIKNIMDFNYLVFENLGKYITTSHIILIQYHGFILDYKQWTNEFLEFSYIGAPWPIRENSYIANDGTRSRVGNGGFSLRSKTLLDLPKKLNIPLKQEQNQWNEDGNICCYSKKEFLDAGIKYAPVEIASFFAYENSVPENYGLSTFGFHRYISPSQVL